MRLILFLLAAVLISSGRAAILRVPGDFVGIQVAIDASADGDTVLVSPGTYLERLIIPDRSLTLCSDDLLTGDSLSIDSTIVDAEWLGTALRVRSQGVHVFRLEGLTLQRGRGLYENGRPLGAGVHLESGANVVLRHLVLRENRSTVYGAAIKSADATHPGHVVIEDLRLHPYRVSSDPNSYESQIRILFANRLEARKWRFPTSTLPSDLVLTLADTCFVNDIVVNSQTSVNIGLAFTVVNYLEADSIIMHDCHMQNGTLLSLESTNPSVDVIRVSNITIDGCSNTTDYDDHGPGILEIGSDTLYADHITVRNCFNATYELAYMFAGVSGIVQHMLVEDNECGAEPQEEYGCYLNCAGQMVKSANCSFEDLVIQRNTSHVYPMISSVNPATYAVGGGYGLYVNLYEYLARNENFFRRMIIQDNLVLDHDDYTNNDIRRDANLGRAVHMEIERAYRRKKVVVEDCIFRRNRQPNSAPEEHTSDPEIDGRMVGSSVSFLFGDRNETNRGKLWLKNVLVEDNDDGGLDVIAPVSLNAQNVVVRNNGRMGFLCSSDTLNLTNILVSGTERWESHYTYPYSDMHPSYQTALGLELGYGGTIRNLSLLDNDTEFLFSTNSSSRPRLQIHNSILWGNTCRYLTNPMWDLQEFPPPLFRYTLMDENQVGEGNLYNLSPQFDAQLGPPYLSPTSPCIDSGDPNVAWNDVENPANPGFALWPALGTLRNDMGYTGGPQATEIDTSWVGLQRPKPNPARPEGFTLGNPYPNPFNPVTLIPFSLDRPRHVRLSVHNLLGQEVAVLVDNIVPAGTHAAQFGTKQLASGTYLVTLESGARSESRTITLLR
ncbi:MAG: T9SS type A sorting domain-containing protein [Candidatus Delongbacteria bacterium]